jgi:hypothetical protein
MITARTWNGAIEGHKMALPDPESAALTAMDSDSGDTQERLPSAAYWRQRAERARVCAREMRVSDAEQALLGIAKIYDSMADRAAEREARKRAMARVAPLRRSSDDIREQA